EGSVRRTPPFGHRQRDATLQDGRCVGLSDASPEEQITVLGPVVVTGEQFEVGETVVVEIEGDGVRVRVYHADDVGVEVVVDDLGAGLRGDDEGDAGGGGVGGEAAGEGGGELRIHGAPERGMPEAG